MKIFVLFVIAVVVLSHTALSQEEARISARKSDSLRVSGALPFVVTPGAPSGRFVIMPDHEGRTGFDARLAASLQRALDSVRTTQGVAGVSAAVLVPGQGVWAGVSGISSKSPSAAVAPEMLFGIGSNTKAFISTTILSLVDAGKLSLDDSLGRWLPAYPNITSRVTIRQLLNMTSGLFDYLNDSGAQGDSVAANPTRRWSPEELIHTFVGAPHRLPGGAYTYCNTDYVLLGMVIKKVTGASVASQMRERILTPLGLDHTYLEVEESYTEPVVHPWDGGVDFASIPVDAHFSTLWTAGGVMSTGENMARWVKALYEGSVLTPSALSQLLTFVPMTSAPAPGLEWNGYGLGVRRGAYYGSRVFGHAGAVMGYVSITGYIPRTGASFAILFNTSEGSTGKALTALLDAYLRSVPTSVVHPGDCYAIAGAGDSSRVYRADTTTGVLTAIGAPQYGTITGARVDPRTGRFWGLVNAGGWELIEIDGETGQAFPRMRIRFPSGAPTDFKGIEFTSDGALLVGAVDGRIYRITLSTGTAVLAAASKISISGLAIDPVSGALWASIRTNATLRDRIYRIDLATGDTVCAGLTGFNQPLADLAFDAAGNLFGLVGNPSSGVKYRLARINKVTGAGTEIGPVGLTGMAGIAFSPQSVSTSAHRESAADRPAGFTLEQNYPNPFNPATTISFTLQSQSFVTMKIYDMMGREASTLWSGEMAPGIHSIRWNASAFPSGMYVCRLQAGSFTAARRMLLLK